MILFLILFLSCSRFDDSLYKSKEKRGNGLSSNNGYNEISEKPKIIFPDGFVVEVRLAISDREKMMGLMFVEMLPENEGMLFVNKEDSQNPFWMKNCFIPLDIIWLDKDFTVVDISKNLPACYEDPCPNYYPEMPYRYALEVNGGIADLHNLRKGDRLVFTGNLENF